MATLKTHNADAEPLPTWALIRAQLAELGDAVAAGDGARARGLAEALAVSPWPAVPVGVPVAVALGELANATDVAAQASAIEKVARERGGYWIAVADRCRAASAHFAPLQLQ